MTEIECNVHKNIIAGFEKCGISPMNRNKVLDRLPSTNLEAGNENFKGAIDETVLSMLKEMRYGTGNLKTSNKRKKIDVIPGKSVENIISTRESEDLDDTLELSDDESNTEEIQDNNLNSINFNILAEPGPSKSKKPDNKFMKKKEIKMTQKEYGDQNEETYFRNNEFGIETENEKALSQTLKIQKGKGEKTDNPSLVKKTKIKKERVTDMKKDNEAVQTSP